eukprot:m.43741 g.43741  ORF g.43741 m.43741 type:complete len:67 (+) comp19478_c0_seq1:142-342(+)
MRTTQSTTIHLSSIHTAIYANLRQSMSINDNPSQVNTMLRDFEHGVNVDGAVFRPCEARVRCCTPV